MALNGSVHTSGQYALLFNSGTISTAQTAVTSTPVKFLSGMNYVCCNAIFLYGADGTSAKAWVQTSLDGSTWIDIMSFAFATAAGNKVSAVTSRIAPATQAATPTDGSLADNTIIQGTLGRWLRVKFTSTGTYSGATSLNIHCVAKG